MSIVINMVSPTKSWIMSDGLRTAAGTGNVVEGSLQKFQLIHDQLCIGYTGDYEYICAILQNFKAINPLPDTITVEDAVTILDGILQVGRSQLPQARAQFLITGISQQDGLITATLGSGKETTFYRPEFGQKLFATLHNASTADFEDFFLREQAKRTKPFDYAVQCAMQATVENTALEDPTVNTNTFFHIIRLHRQPRQCDQL